jgi:hypothetical protein
MPCGILLHRAISRLNQSTYFMEGILVLVTCLALAFSGAFSDFASGATVGAPAVLSGFSPQPAKIRQNVNAAMGKEIFFILAFLVFSIALH